MRIATYFLRFHKLLIVPPVAVGIAVLVLFVLNRAQPKRKPMVEEARTLRVIQVPTVDLVPMVVGHGTVQAGTIWRAIAEVGGRCVEVHPDLEAGVVVNANVQVVRIDSTEYELAIAQLEADIEQLKAQRAELTVRESSDQESLKIEESSLLLAESELSRHQNLRRQNATSATEVDRQMRAVLLQRQIVQKLRSSLNTLPHQMKALDASIAARNTKLQQANLDLAKTVIRTPFDCRLGDLNIEVGQYLASGELLFEAQGIDVVEIEAQVPFDQLRRLIRSGENAKAFLSFDMDTMRGIFDVEVTVRMGSGEFRAEWEGQFSRIRERVDVRTRTAGIVVVVDRPYEKIIPGVRPPLVPGMFCEVELRAKPRPGQIIVPRLAVREGHVCVVDSASRLRTIPVDIMFAQLDFYCLKGGLDPDQMLIVSDPTPAIDGMLVDPIPDEELLRSIVAQAADPGGTQ